MDTRQEILQRDSLVPVVVNSNNIVIRGLWVDPYTGTDSTSPYDFDIEHAYALKDAHYAGARYLSPEDKEKFANDERHLFAAWKGSNRSKGAKSIIEWVPSDLSFLGKYADMRRTMIEDYNLKPKECEQKALDYFDGAGKFFERGINLLKLQKWLDRNHDILNHKCFGRFRI